MADDDVREDVRRALRGTRRREQVRERRRNIGTAVATLLAGLTATATGVASFTALGLKDQTQTDLRQSQVDNQTAQTVKVAQILKAMRLEINDLRKRQDALSSPATPTQIGIDRRYFDGRLGDLDKREAKLEAVIEADPAKSLELPLMRKDIDANKEQVTSNLTSIQKEVEQIYDLSKWLIGGLTISIISLAVATFLKKDKA